MNNYKKLSTREHYTLQYDFPNVMNTLYYNNENCLSNKFIVWDLFISIETGEPFKYMHKLTNNCPLIPNATVLHLTSGLEVICVNDRGYQISVRSLYEKHDGRIFFITPSEIQSYDNYSI